METEQFSTELSLDQWKIKEAFLEFNENECLTYPILWDTLKAVLTRKFIALNAYIKNLEKSHTSILTAHLKALEQKKGSLTQEE